MTQVLCSVDLGIALDWLEEIRLRTYIYLVALFAARLSGTAIAPLHSVYDMPAFYSGMLHRCTLRYLARNNLFM